MEPPARARQVSMVETALLVLTDPTEAMMPEMEEQVSRRAMDPTSSSLTLPFITLSSLMAVTAGTAALVAEEVPEAREVKAVTEEQELLAVAPSELGVMAGMADMEGSAGTAVRAAMEETVARPATLAQHIDRATNLQPATMEERAVPGATPALEEPPELVVRVATAAPEDLTLRARLRLGQMAKMELPGIIVQMVATGRREAQARMATTEELI
jgi:hypothetical protein